MTLHLEAVSSQIGQDLNKGRRTPAVSHSGTNRAISNNPTDPAQPPTLVMSNPTFLQRCGGRAEMEACSFHRRIADKKERGGFAERARNKAQWTGDTHTEETMRCSQLTHLPACAEASTAHRSKQLGKGGETMGLVQPYHGIFFIACERKRPNHRRSSGAG